MSGSTVAALNVFFLVCVEESLHAHRCQSCQQPEPLMSHVISSGGLIALAYFAGQAVHSHAFYMYSPPHLYHCSSSDSH